MGSLRKGPWLQQVLVFLLLLQLQSVTVQEIHSVSQKLQRLHDQFKALTQARLDMLVLNLNRNSSKALESRVQALVHHYHYVSQDLEQLKLGATQEIEGLREWSRKLEKKNKRVEGRLALLERNLRENCYHSQKLKLDPDLDFFNLTIELKDQEERLAALQVQRDELLIGLKGLQESLKSQGQRVIRLEGLLGEMLEGNRKWKIRESREPVKFNFQHQYQEPNRRGQSHRGGRRRWIQEGNHQHKPECISQIQTFGQHTKDSKLKKPSLQQGFHPQIQIQHPNTESQSDLSDDQSQIQTPAQTQLSLNQHRYHMSHQTVDYPHGHIHPQVEQTSQPHAYPWKKTSLQDRNQASRSQTLSQIPSLPEPHENIQDKTRLRDVFFKTTAGPYLPKVNHWDDGEDRNDTKVESSVIHDFLHIPVRNKIPAQPISKKDATICNVDSMLLFPLASAENFVTFSLSLPHLPELSLCLWLRVEAPHIGTLFSYAIEDNDNQIVLYGHSSPPSSAPISVSSSPSLDFVIGDPVYRRLPASSLLDAQWHHLCVLWSSIQGHFWHYTDHHLISSGSDFRKGWEIPGGGSVVLGQEQDSVGGGFDNAEGFAGQIAGFMLWNRVLSPLEVEGVAEGRGVPRGVVLSMEDVKVHGEVQQVACECLEHCVY
ncbi:uncharacterized protein ptx4 [Pholidichthys leucotaenia]